MKLIQIFAICLLSSILTTSHGQTIVPFSDKRWTIQAQGQVMEGFKGKNSLYLQNGMAYLKDAGFKNGIIEFDIYLSFQTSFSGMVFRLTDAINYEEIYLRAQQSGYPDAFQYTPTFNGDPAWQLYHDQFDGVNDGFISWRPKEKLMGYNAVQTYAFDRWMHVKLLVKGTQAELYLDNMDDPIAFIRQLKIAPTAGAIGIKSNVGPAHFADFTYTATDNLTLKTKDDGYKPSTPPNTIMRWMVSEPFKEDKLKDMKQLDQAFINKLKWNELEAELTGVTNLARLSPVTDSNTVFVKLNVSSAIAQIKKLDFGYSDRVKVYCNGNILYSGTNNFRSRDFRYLGTIGYFDAVYLPLKKGENTIILAISETFGGWGVMAKWENIEGF